MRRRAGGASTVHTARADGDGLRGDVQPDDLAREGAARLAVPVRAVEDVVLRDVVVVRSRTAGGLVKWDTRRARGVVRDLLRVAVVDDCGHVAREGPDGPRGQWFAPDQEELAQGGRR